MRADRITSIVVAALCTVAWAAAALFAAEGDAKPADAKKPPNPLLADPLAGEFEGDGVVLILKSTGDKTYEGEIRRAGKTFPCKLSRTDTGYRGAFTFEGFSYDFTAALDGASIKLTTDEKTFTLKRREAAPPPKTPEPTPQNPLTKPPVVDTKVTAIPKVERIDYSKLSTAQLRLLNWSRFKNGSFAEFEESAGAMALLQDPSAAKTTLRMRTKAVFEGVSDGKAALRGFRLEDGNWVTAERPPAAPAHDSQRIGELGYTRGETKAEPIEIDGKQVACERTSYSGQIHVKDSAVAVTADVWRSKDIDHPPLTLDLPQRTRLLVEPDIAQVRVRVQYPDVKVEMEMTTLAAGRELLVAQQLLSYSVVKNTTIITAGAKTLRRVTEYWLSHQVPGSLLKVIETEEKGTDIVQRQTVLVGFEAKP